MGKKAPRLNHTKSRAGCLRCKARKVKVCIFRIVAQWPTLIRKCDEIRPICGGCKRHDVVCQYAKSISTYGENERGVVIVQADLSHLNGDYGSDGTRHENSVTSASGSPAPPLSLELAESRERRVLELHLLHTFTTKVAQTMPGGDRPEAHAAGANDTPKLALQYDGLLYAVLSISASYIATTCPPDTPNEQVTGFLEARRRYFSLALSEHNNALFRLDQSNADAVCLTCTVIGILTFHMAQEEHLLAKPDA